MHMATRTRPWTLSDLDRLPDDGNKYELVRGELFVTPAPKPQHEGIIARLNVVILPYVAANRLGMVFHARAVVRIDGSEVEPDLMVRHWDEKDGMTWEEAPIPSLVVEVLSDSTRRRDLGAKRDFYLDIGVAEYWVVDREDRSILVMRAGDAPQRVVETLLWNPRGAHEPLLVNVPTIFGAAGANGR